MTYKSTLHSIINSLKEDNFLKLKQDIQNNHLKIKLLDFYKENNLNQVDLNDFDSEMNEEEFKLLNYKTENTVLNFLNNTYYNGNKNRKLQNSLNLSYTLCDLGHTKQGLDKLKEIAETAISYNLFDEAAKAYDYIIEFDHEYKFNLKKSKEISKKIMEIYEIRENYMQYKLLSLQIFSYLNVVNVDKNTLNKYLNHPLLKENAKPKSINACFFYYTALMDLHNIANNQEAILKAVNNAFAYFKGILKNNEYYFLKYHFVLERKAITELKLEKYDELKKTLEVFSKIIIPKKISSNASFMYAHKFIYAKFSLSYYLETDKNKALELIQTKFIGFLNDKQSQLIDKVNIYYNIFYNYIVKFKKNKDVVELSPSFLKFFHKHYEIINPQNSFLTKTFICIFFSAYYTYNKEEFKHLFESKLFHKNEAIFESPKGNYLFVKKLYTIILKAYDLGMFYNEKTVSEYLNIWKDLEEIDIEILSIPKHALPEEYKKIKYELWMMKINKKYA